MSGYNADITQPPDRWSEVDSEYLARTSPQGADPEAEALALVQSALGARQREQARTEELKSVAAEAQNLIDEAKTKWQNIVNKIKSLT